MPDDINDRLNEMLNEGEEETHIDNWFEMEDAGDTAVSFDHLAPEDTELDLGPLTLPKEDHPEDEQEAMAKALSEMDGVIEEVPEDIAEPEDEEVELADLFAEIREKRAAANKDKSTPKGNANTDKNADKQISSNSDKSDRGQAADHSRSSGGSGHTKEEKKNKEEEGGKVLKVKGISKDNELEGTFPWRGWAVVIALILIAVAIVNSPIFSLKTYEIDGNERIKDEDILRDLELHEGDNLFRYAIKHLNETPTVDPRLSSVDVYFEWPSHVYIVVEESQTIGYIYFQGTYLCIDRKGQVANSTNEPDQDLPIIKGIQVKSFSIGESLSTADAERYDAVVTIGSTLRKYELQGVVSEINVHNLDDIILLSKNLEARCGDMNDIGQKIAVFGELLNRRNTPHGVLHIENLNNEIYIEPFE